MTLWAGTAAFADTVSAPGGAPAPVLGKPALWVVRTPEATTYLFGSFHLLKPQFQWETPAVSDAYKAAQDIWFEIPDFDNRTAVMRVLRANGLYTKPELNDHLAPQQVRRLDALMQAHGLPLKNFQAFKPWFVAITLDAKIAVDAGFTPDKGVDMTLYRRAQADKKPISGFETLESQLLIISRIDDQDGLTFLLSTLDDGEGGPDRFLDLSLNWLNGDTDHLASRLNDDMKDKYPGIYDHLLVKRNQAWVPQVEALIHKAGTHMVVVGAGHLIGPDSVIAALQKDGITVSRLQ